MSKTTTTTTTPSNIKIDATPIQKLNRAKPDEKVKAAIIQTLMTSNITRMGGKRIMEIPPELIDVEPKYQRGQRLKQAAEIAEKWDDKKYKYPDVSYRDGRLWAMDGQITTTAAILAGKTVIGINVYEGLTIEEEAELFDTQNDNKSNLKPADVYKSRLFRREPNAVALDTICKKYRLEVFAKTKNTSRRMTSILCAMKYIEDESFGPAYIDWVFGMIDKCENWFAQKSTPISNAHINMFADMYLEGVANNCLDEYTDRFVAVMSHHSPADFDNLAVRILANHDVRSPTKCFCVKIAHGEYVEGTAPHIITPEDED